MTRARRRLVSFALVLLLTAPAAWGRPSRAGSPTHPPSPVGRLLAFVLGWAGLGGGDWLKEGSIIEPNGSEATSVTGEAGSQLDPNGSDATNTNRDEGSIMDPNG